MTARIIEGALKLGSTAWLGVFIGVGFGLVLFVVMDLNGTSAAYARHRAQMDRLASALEQEAARIDALETDTDRLAALKEEVTQLSVAVNGRVVGRWDTGSGADDICDRSTGIQHELLLEVFGHNSCSLVSTRDLLSISELSISSRLKAGDLDGFDNLETLRIYTDQRPPATLLAGPRKIQNFLLEYKAGSCGGTFNVNGVPREIYESGSNCRVAFGDN